MIAISTAFSKALVGLKTENKQDFIELDASCKQSENILKAIDDLLEKNNKSILEINTFGVVIGPGSFTGLRIGTALVKGLCAGSSNNCQVVAISSLDLMAHVFLKKQKVKDNFICVINALSGLCFVCEYSQAGQKLGEEKLIAIEELNKSPLLKVGLENENLTENKIELTAESLLEYALIKAENKDFVDFKSLSPVYLRKSQAEVSLEQKNLKN